MMRFYVGLIVAAVVFTVYAVIDCAFTAPYRVRGLPKAAWVVVVILLPVIGGVLWFWIGRGRESGRVRSMAPDDDPEFLNRLGADRARQERIRKLEEKLAEGDKHGPREDGSDSTGPGRRDA
ncbi:PLDc N-terminal domain-containing protein [Homoserinimonas sp. OAct 916]|uniref:PLDc N-terminal domain-containing protein n=1 Tax=Homoserinimonas sp. OAct 916 TaxID=2211450 RepID=UPI000DBE9698|nr:PLDc N-terminal domain-containing protein [Homoserinimonas sp. OAct 916]